MNLKILEQLELVSLENGYQENIEIWQSYYEGNVKGFHDFKFFNGKEDVAAERYTLGMAKKVAEDWSDYLWTPEGKITVDEGYQDRFEDILHDNNFNSNINDALEKGMALSTVGFLTTKINDKPAIRFINANMMYPIENEDGDSGWAVISQYEQDLYYVSVHYEQLGLTYKTYNYLVKKLDNDKFEVLSNETLERDYDLKPIIESPEPMLNIMKPAIANNIDDSTPYGISVFANALSELKAVDIAFTGLIDDIDTGGRITFFQAETLTDPLSDKPIYPRDKGYYVMEGDNTFNDGTSVMFKEPTIKSDKYTQAIETTLNLLGRKCGLGDNAYTFENGAVYTNTAQVISTNSKFYKTREKYLMALREVLIRMTRALYWIDTGKEYKEDVTVEFDDSIIHDKEQEDKELDFQLMNGLISEVYYWQEKKGMTEDQAKEFVTTQQELRALKELPTEEGGEE